MDKREWSRDFPSPAKKGFVEERMVIRQSVFLDDEEEGLAEAYFERHGHYEGFQEFAGFALDPDDGDRRIIELPAKFDVCHVCDGKGTHVNPSIDSHGISAEEFHDDPDFAEAYFSGRYDVTCYGCGGKRVQPDVDADRCEHDPKLTNLLQRWDDHCADEARYAQEAAWERRMGC